MIARFWHGVTAQEKAEDYLNYLTETGVKDCLATEGNRGVYVLHRNSNCRAHFLFISFWDSMDVVCNFAGVEVEKAVYYPKDEQFLLELEPCVSHYEVKMFSSS